MPTQSKPLTSAVGEARKEKPCSVFGNFRPGIDDRLSGGEDAADADGAPLRESQFLARGLQFGIDEALARSFLYRFLAQAYEYPTAEGWACLCQPDVQAAFRAGLKDLEASGPSTSVVSGASSRAEATSPESETSPRESTTELDRSSRRPDWSSLASAGGSLLNYFTREQFESFASEYVAAFSHAARGSCPLNEIEYGDLKADPLFQPHRLADLAAFFRAFGLEIVDEAGERQDHLAIELEFLSVLSAKEAYALEHQLDAEDLAVCRHAQKDFLREHLGRWAPAFARRVSRAVEHGALKALAEFTGQFVAAECRRFGVHAGSEELVLRPVDEAAENLCASCGIQSLPPGAITTT